MFAHQDTQGPVEIAFTDRHGGISGGPFASLDLSARDAARAGEVAENIDIVADAFTRGHEDADEPSGLPPGTPGPRLVLMRQVHGADVVVVDEPLLATGEVPVADALVTALPGVVLLVRVADCVPVLLADAEAGVVAAVHAGRPGLVAGVVPAAVEAMRSLGARRIRAWLGPHVCGACYEVPAAMRNEVAAVVPAAWAETSWGTPSLDIGAGLRDQLDHQSVAALDIARCTLEDDDLYSYRRQGVESGRFGGLVWRRP